MATSNNDAIPVSPAPWTLKGTFYIFMVYTTAKDAEALLSDPEFVYSPLEAESSFSKDELKGGLSMLQLIRYTDTPVGPYDELVLLPGHFKYTVETNDKNGKVKLEKRKNLRCTRVFVSQEKTCWNGHWNIPKHLARFEFTDLPNGGVKVAVHPLMPNASGQERIESPSPFFRTTFQPSSYLPSFTCSTDWAKYLGLDLSLVHPPLPQGKEAELAGTEQWCKTPAVISSKKTSLGWFDLRQRSHDPGEQMPLLDANEGIGETGDGYENFWPGLGRWRFGFKMEDAVMVVPEPECWSAPK